MLKTIFARLLAFLGFMGLMASQAQAAITVDTATAIADLGTGFAAILGVIVLVFGFRKIAGLFGK